MFDIFFLLFAFFFFFFFFEFCRTYYIIIYSKATSNQQYLSFFGLLFLWSVYHDAKFKMANEIKRSLLGDVIGIRIP